MSWRPNPLLTPVINQVRCTISHSPVINVGVTTRRLRSRRGDLIDGPQSVQRARIADERQELSQGVDQFRAVVAYMEIRGDMALHLRVASAERDQHAQGNELACRDVDAGAGEMVAEAVGRYKALDVLLIGGRGGVKLLDDLIADDVLLDLYSFIL